MDSKRSVIVGLFVGLLSCSGATDETSDDRLAEAEQALVCRGVTLTASKSYSPSVWTDDSQPLSPEARFEIPSEIAVTSGNAGNQTLSLQFHGVVTVFCDYIGGASVEHPTSPPDVALGLKYTLIHCSGGFAGGDSVDTDLVTLHINNGDSAHSPTTVEVTLVEETPCGGIDCTSAPTDDSNPCTIDACDPWIGITHTPDTGASCADSDPCDGAETCDETGVCAAGTPLDADDADDCTIDVCEPGLGVVHRSCNPLDRTVTTTVGESMSFLTTGPDPFQVGVAPGTIDVARAAAIRGRVLDNDGEPIPLANVQVLDHPELGETRTDANGVYTMVVNGGGVLLVDIHAADYLPAQRRVETRWQSYGEAVDTVLIPIDGASTVVDLSTIVVPTEARGSVVTDARGTRQATLIFTPGTDAVAHLPGGSTTPLDVLTVRATEYTVGVNGPSRMPAPLPAMTGYTYAVELTADEADLAGATRLEFSEPVNLYVENFYGFDVGTIIPLGSYNRESGLWEAEPDGVVIEVVSVVGGTADIDIDGDGLSETTLELDAAGISYDERSRLGSLYTAGTTLFFSRIAHFSPWDCNLPTGPEPGGGAGPDGLAGGGEPDGGGGCGQAGSYIECQDQILRETLPIEGTNASLTYSSDRVPGRTENLTVRVPLGATLPSVLQRIDATVEVAGKTLRYSQACPCAPNTVWEATWDGRDVFGRVTQGKQPAKVTVTYVYRRVFLNPLDSRSRNFGTWGNGVLYVNANTVLSVGRVPGIDLMEHGSRHT